MKLERLKPLRFYIARENTDVCYQHSTCMCMWLCLYLLDASSFTACIYAQTLNVYIYISELLKLK